MKKYTKIISSIAIIILFMLIISNTLFAATIGTNKITNNKDLGDAGTKMETIGSRIFTAVSNVGIAVSVVVLAVIGIKYMLGSVEEKAEYKKSIMPYLIGAIFIFSASTIGKIVYSIFKQMT